MTVQLLSECDVSSMPDEQPSESPATRPVPKLYAAHLFSTHTSAVPLLSFVYPAAHAETRLVEGEEQVYVAPDAAFATAVQAVPAQVVAPSVQTSLCVLASPSSQLWPPQPAVEAHDVALAVPE